jgi:hypothetical protein
MFNIEKFGRVYFIRRLWSHNALWSLHLDAPSQRPSTMKYIIRELSSLSSFYRIHHGKHYLVDFLGLIRGQVADLVDKGKFLIEEL